jgi:hypothetical protein
MDKGQQTYCASVLPSDFTGETIAAPVEARWGPTFERRGFIDVIY